MFNNLRGVIEFSGEGDNIEAFVNAVRTSPISLLNIRVFNGKLSGKIYDSNFEQLAFLAEKSGIRITADKKKGAVYTVKRYNRRYGIAIGILFAMAFLFYMSNIVLKIEVEGNNLLSTEQILAVLEDNGIYTKKFIPSINFSSVERNILVNMKNIAWIGIRHRGGRVVVDVDEMVKSPKILAQNIPCNVISSKDAQLIDAKVYSGELVPIVGEGVKKGDLLISGIITDKRGKTTLHHSHGEITGRYSEKVSFSQALNEEVVIPTGEKFIEKQLSFFDIKIPITLEKKIDGEYAEETSITKLSLFTFDLPIGIIYETKEPFKTELYNYSDDEAFDKVLLKVNDYEMNFLSNVKILDREIQRFSDNDKVNVAVKYLLEGDIGTTSEIIGKE